MNRKHNPWAALVGLLLGLLLVIICAGCGVTTETPEPGEPAEESGRFTLDRLPMTNSRYGVGIITDTETGVQYLVYANSAGCGMTVLQEKEG